jgi:hypothetical protein
MGLVHDGRSWSGGSTSYYEVRELQKHLHGRFQTTRCNFLGHDVTGGSCVVVKRSLARFAVGPTAVPPLLLYGIRLLTSAPIMGL